MELQGRQTDFGEKGAALVVLGSLPESMEAATNKAKSHGITYPILYDAETSVTRKVGLWRDVMEMPFMGYVLIDKAGRIVGGDQILSEAKGAAPKNIDQILSALERAQEAAGSVREQSGS